MRQEPHPDLLLQQDQVKQIKTGGTQAADDQAMEAYWQAIEQERAQRRQKLYSAKRIIKL